jgi:hypothetical protein
MIAVSSLLLAFPAPTRQDFPDAADFRHMLEVFGMEPVHAEAVAREHAALRVCYGDAQATMRDHGLETDIDTKTKDYEALAGQFHIGYGLLLDAAQVTPAEIGECLSSNRQCGLAVQHNCHTEAEWAFPPTSLGALMQHLAVASLLPAPSRPARMLSSSSLLGDTTSAMKSLSGGTESGDRRSSSPSSLLGDITSAMTLSGGSGSGDRSSKRSPFADIVGGLPTTPTALRDFVNGMTQRGGDSMPRIDPELLQKYMPLHRRSLNMFGTGGALFGLPTRDTDVGADAVRDLVAALPSEFSDGERSDVRNVLKRLYDAGRKFAQSVFAELPALLKQEMLIDGMRGGDHTKVSLHMVDFLSRTQLAHNLGKRLGLTASESTTIQEALGRLHEPDATAAAASVIMRHIPVAFETDAERASIQKLLDVFPELTRVVAIAYDWLDRSAK